MAKPHSSPKPQLCLAPQKSLPTPPRDSWQPRCPSSPITRSLTRCLRRITTLFIPTQPFHRVQTRQDTHTDSPPTPTSTPRLLPTLPPGTPELPCARRPQPCSDPQPWHTRQTRQGIPALLPLPPLPPAHQKAPLPNSWHQLVASTAQCRDFRTPTDEFGSLNQTSAPPLLRRARG